MRQVRRNPVRLRLSSYRHSHYSHEQVYDLVLSGLEQNTDSALRELDFRGNLQGMDNFGLSSLRNPFKSKTKRQSSVKILR